MKKLVFGSVFLIVLAWLLNLWIDPPTYTMRPMINETRLITGVLAWALMVGCVVIAARPRWIEQVTETSLDELYRWHKYLGIGAVVASLAHFFAKDTIRALKPFLDIGPSGKKAPSFAADFFDEFWMGLKHFTEVSGEWVMYGMLVLVVLCFVKRIPYSRWLTTHRLFGIFVLILAPHALRLMPINDHLTPFGLLNIAITLIGCWYAVRLLVRGPGAGMTQKATLTDVQSHDGVTLVSVQTSYPMNAQAGQFAFLQNEPESKHPYSMIECDGNQVRFAIKALGDHTERDVPTWEVGQTVRIEGPWGHFVPDMKTQSQLWVAGGVGIVPFLAWLKSSSFHHMDVELLWCVKDCCNEPLFAEVQEISQKVGVRLTVVESRIKRLDTSTMFADRLPKAVSICAPERLKEAVKKAYLKAGGSAKAIRNEYFTWRD